LFRSTLTSAGGSALGDGSGGAGSGGAGSGGGGGTGSGAGVGGGTGAGGGTNTAGGGRGFGGRGRGGGTGSGAGVGAATGAGAGTTTARGGRGLGAGGCAAGGGGAFSSAIFSVVCVGGSGLASASSRRTPTIATKCIKSTRPITSTARRSLRGRQPSLGIRFVMGWFNGSGGRCDDRLPRP